MSRASRLITYAFCAYIGLTGLKKSLLHAQDKPITPPSRVEELLSPTNSSEIMMTSQKMGLNLEDHVIGPLHILRGSVSKSVVPSKYFLVSNIDADYLWFETAINVGNYKGVDFGVGPNLGLFNTIHVMGSNRTSADMGGLFSGYGITVEASKRFFGDTEASLASQVNFKSGSFNGKTERGIGKNALDAVRFLMNVKTVADLPLFGKTLLDYDASLIRFGEQYPIIAGSLSHDHRLQARTEGGTLADFLFTKDLVHTYFFMGGGHTSKLPFDISGMKHNYTLTAGLSFSEKTTGGYVGFNFRIGEGKEKKKDPTASVSLTYTYSALGSNLNAGISILFNKPTEVLNKNTSTVLHFMPEAPDRPDYTFDQLKDHIGGDPFAASYWMANYVECGRGGYNPYGSWEEGVVRLKSAPCFPQLITMVRLLEDDWNIWGWGYQPPQEIEMEYYPHIVGALEGKGNRLNLWEWGTWFNTDVRVKDPKDDDKNHTKAIASAQHWFSTPIVMDYTGTHANVIGGIYFFAGKH